MKVRAIVMQSDGWWIGWLVDLPGVNAQERTRERLVEALRIGAGEMLASEVLPRRDGTKAAQQGTERSGKGGTTDSVAF